MKDLFLGLDVGTTGAKAILINSAGKVLTSATSAYSVNVPAPLWSEQNPEDWWTASCQSCQQVLKAAGIAPDDIAGIGLTGQMHGLVLLGKAGNVLRPCIMWNDQRTMPQCEQITCDLGYHRLLRLTGNAILPGFTASKILWVKENEPEIYVKIAHILLPKDYVRYRLTGEFATDLSDASGMSLLDVGNRCWSAAMIRYLQLSPEWLPQLYESPVITGTVSKKAALSSGLKEATPVIAGGGDQAAGAVGCGAVRPGILSVVLGTSGVVFAPVLDWRYEPEGKLHAFCHATPGVWHFMGVTLSAAGSLRWYRDAFCQSEMREAQKQKKDVYDRILKPLSDIPAGSNGLLFLPYLTGERTPWPDPHARGVFFGITNRHNKPHFTRAVLEGVAYSLNDCLQLIKQANLPIEQIRVTGGGSKSVLWRQILANVFNTEIVTVSSADGAPYGAALLAGVGCGLYKSVEEACDETIKLTTRITPQKQISELYDSYYQIYRNLYPALKKQFEQSSLLLS
ncbi:MAG: xylulokinase [Candidatus Marinimicrobia bacterium]|nr:xylulokinase [Candidatus Neomarinimicrobiota bacterium]